MNQVEISFGPESAVLRDAAIVVELSHEEGDAELEDQADGRQDEEHSILSDLVDEPVVGLDVHHAVECDEAAPDQTPVGVSRDGKANPFAKVIPQNVSQRILQVNRRDLKDQHQSEDHPVGLVQEQEEVDWILFGVGLRQIRKNDSP